MSKKLISTHTDDIIREFCTRFTSLPKANGALNKCKFVSYELAKHLQKRGIPARLIHLQGVKSQDDFPDAVQFWKDKPADEWTHYVVKVGSRYYDLTARQMIKDAEYPHVTGLKLLKEQWVKVESDSFLNGFLTEAIDARL